MTSPGTGRVKRSEVAGNPEIFACPGCERGAGRASRCWTPLGIPESEAFSFGVQTARGMKRKAVKFGRRVVSANAVRRKLLVAHQRVFLK